MDVYQMNEDELTPSFRNTGTQSPSIKDVDVISVDVSNRDDPDDPIFNVLVEASSVCIYLIFPVLSEHVGISVFVFVIYLLLGCVGLMSHKHLQHLIIQQQTVSYEKHFLLS